MSKSLIRKAALRERDAAAPELRLAWSRACSRLLTAYIESLGDAPFMVAGYAPMKSEVDVMPALAALAARHVIALPAAARDSKVLSFRRFSPADALATGAYGVKEPSPQAEAVTPDIIIAPLLAFDRAGHRVGYGAGFYDATLASLNARGVIAIGAAFALQEVDAIPAEAFDRRLDAVVTEKEIIHTA